MSERFEYGETDLFEWVEDNGEMISTKECVNKLNEQQTEIDNLKEENEQLKEELNNLKKDETMLYEKALLQFQKGLKRRLNDE